jgi:hypothetical protein
LENQVAFFKMDFKNKFVAHGKIDFRHFAIVKKTVRKATWFFFEALKLQSLKSMKLTATKLHFEISD